MVFVFPSSSWALVPTMMQHLLLQILRAFSAPLRLTLTRSSLENRVYWLLCLWSSSPHQKCPTTQRLTGLTARRPCWRRFASPTLSPPVGVCRRTAPTLRRRVTVISWAFLSWGRSPLLTSSFKSPKMSLDSTSRTETWRRRRFPGMCPWLKRRTAPCSAWSVRSKRGARTFIIQPQKFPPEATPGFKGNLWPAVQCVFKFVIIKE